jgi:hypothetical protein
MQSLSFEARQANEFWHERVGRYLGGANAATSLGFVYPMHTAKGAIRPNRIGAGAPSAVAIDGVGAVIIEALAVDSIPGLVDAPVKVMRGSPEFSLRRGVMDWALDPARVFPLLVLLPGKASARASLKLSRLPTSLAVCSPGGALVFDSLRVRAARDAIAAMGTAGRKWRAASSIRAQVESGSYLSEPAYVGNKLLESLAQVNLSFPPSMWLPADGEPEFDALGEALIESKPGLPIVYDKNLEGETL